MTWTCKDVVAEINGSVCSYLCGRFTLIARSSIPIYPINFCSPWWVCEWWEDWMMPCKHGRALWSSGTWQHMETCRERFEAPQQELHRHCWDRRNSLETKGLRRWGEDLDRRGGGELKALQQQCWGTALGASRREGEVVWLHTASRVFSVSCVLLFFKPIASIFLFLRIPRSPNCQKEQDIIDFPIGRMSEDIPWWFLFHLYFPVFFLPLTIALLLSLQDRRLNCASPLFPRPTDPWADACVLELGTTSPRTVVEWKTRSWTKDQPNGWFRWKRFGTNTNCGESKWSVSLEVFYVKGGVIFYPRVTRRAKKDSLGITGPCFCNIKRAFHQIQRQEVGGETYEKSLPYIDHTNRASIKKKKKKSRRQGDGRESKDEHIATYGGTSHHMAVLHWHYWELYSWYNRGLSYMQCKVVRSVGSIWHFQRCHYGWSVW